jgi:hypothetical protein
MSKWITAGEAARVLSVHPETLRRRSDKIKGLRVKRNHLNQREYWEDDIKLLAKSLSAGHWQLPTNECPEPGPGKVSALDSWLEVVAAWYRGLSFTKHTLLRTAADIASAWAVCLALAWSTAYMFTVVTGPLGSEHGVGYYLDRGPAEGFYWIAVIYSGLRIISSAAILARRYYQRRRMTVSSRSSAD